MIEEDHFDAAARELVQQQDLIGVLAREPVRAVNVQAIDRAGGRHVTQSLQGRSNQRGPAVSFVQKSHLRFQRQTVVGDPLLQRRHLAGNGRRLCLLLRRNPGVDRRDTVNGTFFIIRPSLPVAAASRQGAVRECSWGRRADRRTIGTNRSYADAKTSSDSRERSNACSTLAIRLFGVAVRSIVATSFTARSYTIGLLAT